MLENGQQISPGHLTYPVLTAKVKFEKKKLVSWIADENQSNMLISMMVKHEKDKSLKTYKKEH